MNFTEKNFFSLPFSPEHPWLAPLAGYSDLPFRLLCRFYGAACCTTEMISAKGLLYNSKGTFELLRTVPEDQPLIVQLFGAEAESLGQATALLCQAGYSWFDLNLGCSVAKVLRQKAGAALLGDVDCCLACAKAMLAQAGQGQVGFKLRLGLDANRNILPDLPLRLEDLGAGWITLHPRFAKQGFGGHADWTALQKLAERLTIPLVASGDLLSAEDGLQCLQQTGVSAVMYARGALHNPAIFKEHQQLCAGQTRPALSATAIREVAYKHLTLIERYAPSQQQAKRMRGVLCGYLRGLPKARVLREALCQCTTWEGLYQILQHVE